MSDLTGLNDDEIMLLREALSEYIGVRGGGMEPITLGVARYVETRYAHMDTKFRDDKGRDVLRRVRLAMALRSKI